MPQSWFTTSLTSTGVTALGLLPIDCLCPLFSFNWNLCDRCKWQIQSCQSTAQNLSGISSVHRIRSKISNAFQSFLYLPSSKIYAPNIGNLMLFAMCEDPVLLACFLQFCSVLFCLWATAHGFYLPRIIFLSPYVAIPTFQLVNSFIILQIST